MAVTGRKTPTTKITMSFHNEYLFTQAYLSQLCEQPADTERLAPLLDTLREWWEFADFASYEGGLNFVSTVLDTLEFVEKRRVSSASFLSGKRHRRRVSVSMRWERSTLHRVRVNARRRGVTIHPKML